MYSKNIIDENIADAREEALAPSGGGIQLHPNYGKDGGAGSTHSDAPYRGDVI